MFSYEIIHNYSPFQLCVPFNIVLNLYSLYEKCKIIAGPIKLLLYQCAEKIQLYLMQ